MALFCLAVYNLDRLFQAWHDGCDDHQNAEYSYWCSTAANFGRAWSASLRSGGRHIGSGTGLPRNCTAENGRSASFRDRWLLTINSEKLRWVRLLCPCLNVLHKGLIIVLSLFGSHYLTGIIFIGWPFVYVDHLSLLIVCLISIIRLLVETF